MIRANRAVHCPERRHYVDTARATSTDGLIDNIAVERALNGEPVDGLNEAEQLLAARLLHANNTAVAVIARRIGVGESRVKTLLGLKKKPANTRCASDRARTP